jgi:ABC-2 type transport system permease protein
MSAKAEIHDVGYATYRGPRTPPSRRFWVIAKNVFGVAWRSRWGVKFPFIVAAGTALTCSVIMYVLRNSLVDKVRARGAPIPRAEQIIFNGMIGFELAAYVLAAVVGCAAVANDLRLGAFQFYFSRPLRARDYLAGKLLGLALVIGVPMFCGPMLLAIVRLCFADDWGKAVSLLPVLPQAALLGILGTAAFVLPPVALGALIGKRQPAQALYIVCFVVLATAAEGMARVLEFPLLTLVDVRNDVDVVGRALFGVADIWPNLGPWPAAAALAIICGLSVAILWWRVSRAETSELGGS